jgi:hypothetical protein
MGGRFLSAVRFSLPMAFTVSITMMGSTMVAFPMGVSGTAAFTEAGGERQAHRLPWSAVYGMGEGACIVPKDRTEQN